MVSKAVTRDCGLLPGLGNREPRMMARSVKDRKAGQKSTELRPAKRSRSSSNRLKTRSAYFEPLKKRLVTVGFSKKGGDMIRHHSDAELKEWPYRSQRIP